MDGDGDGDGDDTQAALNAAAEFGQVLHVAA